MLLQLAVLCTPLFLVFLYRKVYYHRKQQFAAWPQLAPSLAWGHIKGLHEFINRGERNRHIDIVLSEIKEHLGHPPLFILDLRPVQPPLGVVCSHEVAEQISRNTKAFPYSMAKSPTMSTFDSLFGAHSIISAQGEKWKGLRKRFNPGFNPQHLLSLLPCIVDRSWRFLEHLDRLAASGEEFTLDELCINLTFDIIGAVTMDEDFRAQSPKSERSEIVSLTRDLTISFTTGTRSVDAQWGFKRAVRRLQQWKMSRRVDALLKEHIQRKFADQAALDTSSKKKSRSILALSLQGTTALTPEILSQTSDQLKSFLFAGHDTTSILLQWAFYELGRTPRALKAIRQELDEIFGADPSPAVVRDKLLSSDGEVLIQKMSYVSAVIKETLRLYPPSGSARYQAPGTGFMVSLPDGTPLCLDGVVMYNCETLIQRDEGVYGATKDTFMPERWLGDTDTSMQTNAEADEKGTKDRIPASAWRPFERGPRNCIGQELANLEARVILACTVRRYDFTKVGLGEIARDASGEAVMDEKEQSVVKSRLYNTMQVTAKPIDGTRMRVRLASGARPSLE